MGTTLQNGVYLPNEGERNCYAGLKTNWEILDQKVADVTALQQAVAGALHREIVESLPTTDIDPNTIYMILSGTSATENVYNEYMYVNNAWELIGTSATDLTNYYTKAEVDGKLLLKASASDLTSHTGDTTIHVTTADKNKWNNGVSQAYVFRYSSTALTASSTNSNALLDNTDNLKVGDKVIDSSGVLFSITAIDTANSTFTIGTALIDLAQDSDVVHKSGNEVISGEKNFKNTSTDYSGIKLEGTRVCYITADNANDGVFPANVCSSSLLLPDGNKSIHVGRWTSSNNRIFLDKSYPYMDLNGIILKSNTYVPTGETGTATLRLMAQLNFADDTNKNVDVRLTQYDSTSSTLYSNTDNVTSLGSTTKRWSKIYGTEYYYGSNNVEFSTKFVTTDTNQTISGAKTFSDNPVIGNNNTNITISNRQITANGSYPAPTGSSYSFMQLKAVVNYADSSPSIGATVGLSVQENAYSDGKRAGFYPNSNNTTNLGLSGKRWANVYATNYYYGGSEIEFSQKFVTTDTAQTISGNKTFSSNTLIYNSDNTANTPNLILQSSKIQLGDTSNSDSQALVFNAGSSYVAKVDSYKDGSGTQNLQYRVRTKDASNNVISAMYRLRLFNTGLAFLSSDTDNTIALGSTSIKWKDCQTYLVNGVEPSSLSLPSGNVSDVIDISSYITALDGTSNSYTVPANGWISIAVVGTAIDIASSSWSDSRLRASSGNVRMLYPVLKNETLDISVTGTTLAYARFIPCQGNV